MSTGYGDSRPGVPTFRGHASPQQPMTAGHGTQPQQPTYGGAGAVPESIGQQPQQNGSTFGLFNGAAPQNVGPHMPTMFAASAESRARALQRGPMSHSRFLGGITFNLGYIVLFFLAAASTVLAVLEMLDALAVGFRIPLIPLIVHVILFVLFLLFSVWRVSAFMMERILEDRLQATLVGVLFTLMHFAGTVAFIIWTAKYGNANERVAFSEEPVGLIAFVAISAAFFVWYGICIVAWTLVCAMRYDHNKAIETIAIVTGGKLTEIMAAAAGAQGGV